MLSGFYFYWLDGFKIFISEKLKNGVSTFSFLKS